MKKEFEISKQPDGEKKKSNSVSRLFEEGALEDRIQNIKEEKIMKPGQDIFVFPADRFITLLN